MTDKPDITNRDGPMRIAWLSNAPWASTGYGNQTRVFTPRLNAHHPVSIIAFYGLQGAVLNWNGIQVLPRGYDDYGNDVLSAHSTATHSDITISLLDAWVIQPQMIAKHTRWIPWFPVDMEPLPPPVRDRVAQAYKRIVFSRFAERMVHAAGLDCYYVPHGVETNVFCPGDKQAARERIGLPGDAFVVGMVAANKGNPSRKAFAPQIKAFAQFKRAHRDALLYLHCTRGERGEMGGVNLPELCTYYGLQEGRDVMFADQYTMIVGFSDDYMTALYRSMDVHMLVSMGEGFGIPTVEAQACGTPVITSGWTASRELCFGGWTIEGHDDDEWWTPLGAVQWQPRASEILAALEEAYDADLDALGAEARAGALNYDADYVTERYWLPVLADIAGTLEEPQPKKTRRGRRAAKRESA